jgi:hypothetical protein
MAVKVNESGANNQPFGVKDIKICLGWGISKPRDFAIGDEQGANPVDALT